MIWRIWVQCLTILFMMAIPLMAIQYFQQKESLEIISELSNHNEADNLLSQQMQRLQELAALKPQQEELYKKEFFKILDYKKKLIATKQVQRSVVNTIERQSLINAIATLLLSVLLSLLVSWNIVRHFKKLLQENELALKRKQELVELEKWQNTARTLVHEIRAPLTPIKLISSAWQNSLLDSQEPIANQENDLYSKSPATSINLISKDILSEGLDIICAKLQLIESMINRFTLFAKLPAPIFKNQLLSAVVQNFIVQYQASFKNAELNLHLDLVDEPCIQLDEGLLHNSFFAIVKNAIEANSNKKLLINFILQKGKQQMSLLIHNNGEAIPQNIIAHLFEFGVSSKLPGSQNFGIGLAMAKKIVFDHNGEIQLSCNKHNEAVGFALRFNKET